LVAQGSWGRIFDLHGLSEQPVTSNQDNR